MKYYLFILSGILFMWQNSAAQNTETRELGLFSKIEVFGSIDLEITKGDKNVAKLESKDVDLSEVKTTIKNNTLKISISDQLFDKKKHLNIQLTCKELKEIEGNGGAQVTAMSVIEGDKLVILGGSGSSIQAKVNLKSIEANAGEGGLISLEGKTSILTVTAVSGGTFDGYGLEADSTYVKSNTGSVCKVTANKFVDAAASTGGFIGLKGNPEKRQLKTTLGGKINLAVETEE
jgi:hypothetical protein